MSTGNESEKDPKAGHRERLWQRYDAKGFRAAFFHPYEKLEFLLTLAIPRRDVKPIARALVERFKTLGGVLNAPAEQLQQITGIGRRAALTLHLFREVALIIDEEGMTHGEVLDQPDKVRRYLKLEIAWEEAETFWAMFLDSKNRLILKECLTRGTINRSPVYPREIAKAALARNAAAVLIAHNHPSGDPTPSREDIELTHTVARLLKELDITLHDHFIVGKDSVVSLRETGQWP